MDLLKWFREEHRYVPAKPTTDTATLTSTLRKVERLRRAMQNGHAREVAELQQWLLKNGQSVPETVHEADSLMDSLKRIGR